MKKNILILLLLLGLSIFVNSCCDCPLEPSDLKLKCNVREASITDFNPNLTLKPGTADTLIPVPEYSIHTFLFPNDNNSSGSLPNDERFASSSTITTLSLPFSDGRPYYVAIIDNIPFNGNQNGDILVDSVFYDNATPTNSYAFIRVKGQIQRTNYQFNFDNAQLFCDFVSNNSSSLLDLFKDLKLYGSGIVGDTKIRSYNAADIKVIDIGGKVVNNINPSQTDIDKLLLLSQQGTDILIKPGDVFVYQAVNNRRFVFSVANIGLGMFQPFKKRVTIMFTAIN